MVDHLDRLSMFCLAVCLSMYRCRICLMNCGLQAGRQGHHGSKSGVSKRAVITMRLARDGILHTRRSTQPCCWLTILCLSDCHALTT